MPASRLLVRPETREVLRDGAPVHVETRVFDLLLALIEAQGAVLDKDSLIARVWQGRPVSDDAIASAVRDLRRALGDDGRRQKIVKTVYGRGVQLVTQIHLDDKTHRPALIVRPFDAPNGFDAAARALTLDVTVALSRTKSVPVIAHETALAAQSATSPGMVRWGLGFVLTGGVQEVAGQVQVSLLLTEHASGAVVWSDRRTASLAELIAGLAELADDIAARIETELTLHSAARAQLLPIEDLDAWSAYHRAIRALMRFRVDQADEVEALLAHAAQLDRGSARIKAAQSHLEWQRAFLLSGQAREAARQRALGAAEAALSLDPHDPQAHWALGRTHLIAGETGAARSALRQAIALNPSFANAYYSLGWTMSHEGTPAPGAIALPQKARRLSPLDPVRYAFDLLEADLSFFAGDTAHAQRLARDAAQNTAAHHQAKAIAAWLLYATGAETEAHLLAAEVRRTRPGYGLGDYLATVPAKGRKRATIEKTFRALGF